MWNGWLLHICMCQMNSGNVNEEKNIIDLWDFILYNRALTNCHGSYSVEVSNLLDYSGNGTTYDDVSEIVP